MLITKKSDYALRICRVLRDGKTHSVGDICEKENVPKAFAYKIIRGMEQAGIVESERGNKGGYRLLRKLDELTVYDIVANTEDDVAIVHCINEECERNTNDMPCRMHMEMERIQSILEKEMKGRTIEEILG